MQELSIVTMVVSRAVVSWMMRLLFMVLLLAVNRMMMSMATVVMVMEQPV